MIINTVEEALDFVLKEFDSYKKKTDETIPSIKKLIPYDIKPFDILNYRLQYVTNTGTYRGSYASYYNDCNTSCKTIDQIKARQEALLVYLDSILPKLEETKLQNEQIIEHNKTVIAKINMFMQTVGIPDSYQERDLKSRARVPKYIRHTAGYKGDITRNIPTVDSSYKGIVFNIDNKKKEVDKWASSAIASITELEKAKEQSDLEQKKLHTLATLRVKYNLDFSATEEEILDCILSKCKYLKLAHYLLKNREDWNDGPYWASVGLDSFTVGGDNDHDQKILDCLEPLISDWDGDGRVFRDCEWSYSDIFNLVSTELKSDYQILKDLMPG